MKKNLLRLLPFVFVLVSQTYAYEEKYCKDKIEKFQNEHLQKSKLPNIDLRDSVFYCSDITDSINKLDALDKDFIYMKALHNTREKFDNSYTETSSPIQYSTLIEEEKIDRLFSILQKIYNYMFIDTFKHNEINKEIDIYKKKDLIVSDDFRLYRDEEFIYVLDAKRNKRIGKFSIHIEDYIHIEADKKGVAKIIYYTIEESLIGDNYNIPQSYINELVYKNGMYISK